MPAVPPSPSPRWRWHGGGLAAARAHFGGATDAWIDLSTGINPQAWPGADACTPDWRRLPDDDALAALETAAAAHFGTDPAHVCALPGTEVGLRLLGTLLSGPAYCRAPAYRTHAAMLGGATPLPEDALAEADGASLILANPNNPDGRLWSREALLALLEMRGPEGWLILDEAFAEATPGHSLAAHITDERRLILFRSFGKFFGLPGLRLGFLLGPRPLLARMRDRLGAWPLSAAALAIGTAAYRDRAWIAAQPDRLRAQAAALDDALARHGYRTTGACPLFRLIAMDGADAADALFVHLARHRILTRPFDAAPQWVRFGLPAGPEESARLDAALAAFAPNATGSAARAARADESDTQAAPRPPLSAESRPVHG